MFYINLKIDSMSSDEKIDNDEFGNNFGYYEEYLNAPIMPHKLDYEKEYEGNADALKEFRIMTYNIWGLFKEKSDMIFTNKITRMRIAKITEIIKESKADIVCLQEVTNFAAAYFKEHLSYPYLYEE